MTIVGTGGGGGGENTNLNVSLEISSTHGLQVPYEVNVEAKISGGIPPYSYYWDFDGDGRYDEYEQNTTFFYKDFGTYNLTLKVYDSSNNSSEVKEIIIVGSEQLQITIGINGGKAGLQNGSQVEIPEGVFSNETLITISLIDEYPEQGQGVIVGEVCDISMEGEQEFNNEVIICFRYDPTGLTEIEEDGLAIHYYDRQQEEWIYIPSFIDKISNKVCAYVDHFTLFGIGFNWECWMPDWDWIPVSDDDKVLCNYIDELEDDICALEDQEDYLVRAIGLDHYNNIKNSLEKSKSKAEEQIGQELEDDLIQKMTEYFSKKEHTIDKLNDFWESGNRDSYSEAYDSAKNMVQLYHSIESLFNILDKNWYGMLTGYALTELKRAELDIALELFEISAGARKTGAEVNHTFFQASCFEGTEILDSDEFQDIRLGVDAGLVDKFVPQIVKSIDRPNNSDLCFSFALVEPKKCWPSGSLSWQVCKERDWIGNCEENIGYPVNENSITDDTNGTYALIYSFEGFDRDYAYAGISLTVDEKIIAYTTIRRPFRAYVSRIWGYSLMPKNAFTDLKSDQLTVTLRLFKNDASISVPSGTGTYVYSIAEGKFTLLTGEWQETSSLDTPIDSPGAAFVENHYIYCPGGWGSARGTFHYAEINSNGTLGEWAATKSMPNSHHTQSSATSYDGVIYLVGGHQPNWWTSSVYYAVPNSDGSISSWISTTSLPSSKGGSGAFGYNGYLYSTGGTNSYSGGQNALTEVRYAQINSNGSIGSWQSTTALPVGRCYHGATAYNGYVYIVGGEYAGPSKTATEVLYAPIYSGGTIGSWQQTTSLPSSEGSNLPSCKVFALDDYLYLCKLWGKNYRAVINSDGTLGAWVEWEAISLDQPNDFIGTYTMDPDTKHLYGLGGRLSDGTVTSDKVYYISLEP